MTIIAGGMENRRHDHRLPGFQYFVDHAVREAVGIAPAHVLSRMTTGIEKGIFGQCIPYLDNFLDEFRPESGLPAFIPSGGFRHILLHFRAELDPPVHFAKRERRRAFISSSGTAESGFRQ